MNDKLPVPANDASKEEWDAWSEQKKKSIIGDMRGKFFAALEEKGLNPDLFASKLKRLSDAKKVSWQKVKGILPQGIKLPTGYKVITPTEQTEVFDEATGMVITADVGETLIQYVGPDNALQLKVVQALMKVFSIQGSDKQEVESNGTVIHVHTAMPGPDPLPPGLANTKQIDIDINEED